jgi:hypothetical protein
MFKSNFIITCQMICCDQVLFFSSKTGQSIGERRLWSNRLLIVFFFYSHRIYKHDMRKERECAWGTVPRPYKLITSVRSTNASNRPFSFYFFTAPVFAPFGETDAAAAFVLFLFYQYIVDLNATIHFIFTRLRYYYYYYYSEKRLVSIDHYVVRWKYQWRITNNSSFSYCSII